MTAEKRAALSLTLEKMEAARDRLLMGEAVSQVSYESWGHTYHAPNLEALQARISEIKRALGQTGQRRSVSVGFR